MESKQLQEALLTLRRSLTNYLLLNLQKYPALQPSCGPRVGQISLNQDCSAVSFDQDWGQFEHKPKHAEIPIDCLVDEGKLKAFAEKRFAENEEADQERREGLKELLNSEVFLKNKKFLNISHLQ